LRVQEDDLNAGSATALRRGRGIFQQKNIRDQILLPPPIYKIPNHLVGNFMSYKNCKKLKEMIEYLRLWQKIPKKKQ